MTRISNRATMWMQILWPIFAFAILIYVIYQIQAGATNASQLVVIVAAMAIWRRIFGNDPFEVLEGDTAVLVKKARMSFRISYDQIERVEVSGGRVTVATSDPRLKKFSFLPSNTSYLSTGKTRSQALDQFTSEFAARLKSHTKKK